MLERLLIGVVANELHERIGHALCARRPRLPLGRPHPIDHVAEHRLDERTVDIRDARTTEAEHRGLVVPPAVQSAKLRAGRGPLPRRARRWQRANRFRSAGVVWGARRAHSASDAASASCATAASWWLLMPPACATAATSGRDSSARAVSTLARTSRTATPSATASESSTMPLSSSTATTASSSTRSRRCSATSSSRRPRSQSVEWVRSSSSRTT